MIHQVVDGNHRLGAENHFSLSKHRFGKSYGSKEEHEYMFNTFKANMRRARRHQNLNPIVVHNVTLFSNMTLPKLWKVLGPSGLRFPAKVNKVANQCSYRWL
ncbi:hypothetical protein K1719_025882 [Acacia pycnantha]|nr:hypothetical protein K1719_025882 [Acacia pycnantha]